MPRFLTLSLCAALCLLPAAAQEPESPTIRANVPLVLVPVTVNDKKGNPIDGLKVEDFRLTDDMIAQKLRLDTSDTILAPVSLVVLIQSSGISSPALARIDQVGPMIKPLVVGERGQAAVIAFDDEVRVLAPFTSDASRISSSFQNIAHRSMRKARMLDAVAEGVKMLDTRPANNRRVMLLLSESRDRGSKADLKDVIEMAQRAGVAMYFATYSVQGSTFVSRPSDAPSMPGDANYIQGLIELVRLGKVNAADAFARATGGRHLAFLTRESLEAAISKAGEEIHSQYLLSFTPSQSKNEGFHSLQVAIPSRPDAVIRVRPGYWPQK
jgi:VWFA-related protein